MWRSPWSRSGQKELCQLPLQGEPGRCVPTDVLMRGRLTCSIPMQHQSCWPLGLKVCSTSYLRRQTCEAESVVCIRTYDVNWRVVIRSVGVLFDEVGVSSIREGRRRCMARNAPCRNNPHGDSWRRIPQPKGRRCALYFVLSYQCKVTRYLT